MTHHAEQMIVYLAGTEVYHMSGQGDRANLSMLMAEGWRIAVITPPATGTTGGYHATHAYAVLERDRVEDDVEHAPLAPSVNVDAHALRLRHQM